MFPKAKIKSPDGREYTMCGLDKRDLMFQRYESNGAFYEDALLQDIAKMGIKGTYYDVGANIGNHTVWFATQCPAEQTIAVEAHPKIAEVLADNIRENCNGKAVKLLNAAVMPVSGFASCRDINPHNVGSTKVDALPGPIRAVTLLELIAMAGAPPALVKLDVEGWEFRILAAAIEMLRDIKPVLVIEISKDLNVFNELLKGFGYRYGRRYNYTPTYIWRA